MFEFIRTYEEDIRNEKYQRLDSDLIKRDYRLTGEDLEGTMVWVYRINSRAVTPVTVSLVEGYLCKAKDRLETYEEEVKPELRKIGEGKDGEFVLTLRALGI